ncbi:MAG: hypothetical protein HYV41_04150 [Candidatus Magasanikbacteria bacterium]|nr:hypothetical protein [Candidatus Magasanikbacteria bacterium]
MRYIFLLAIIFFIFGGIACTSTKPIFQNQSSTSIPNQPTNTIVNQADQYSIFGEWRYAYAKPQDTYVDRVTIFIEPAYNDLDTRYIKGSMLAIRQEYGVAKYIDAGVFTGNQTQSKGAYTITWQGDRQDSGTATLEYDAPSHILRWTTTIVDASDGLFTIPDTMTIYRVMTPLLTSEDRNEIAKLVQAYYTENFPMEVIPTIESYIAEVVKVSIQPKDSITDPAYMYMKKENGVWISIWGPELYILREDAIENNIPDVLAY